MIRKFILITVLISGLVACGTSNETDNSDSMEQEQSPQDIATDEQMSHNWDQINPVGDYEETLKKLPKEVQEYLSNASIHVMKPFYEDPQAREILLKAMEIIPDFNSNDVDILISNSQNDTQSYEERLEHLLSEEE